MLISSKWTESERDALIDKIKKELNGYVWTGQPIGMLLVHGASREHQLLRLVAWLEHATSEDLERCRHMFAEFLTR